MSTRKIAARVLRKLSRGLDGVDQRLLAAANELHDLAERIDPSWPPKKELRYTGVVTEAWQRLMAAAYVAPPSDKIHGRNA